MARVQRIAMVGAPDTYTVLGTDHLPIPAAEEYLQFLRDDESSPNTVKSYAAGLAAWWTVLEHTGTGWQDVSTALFGQFLAYLRTGDLPGTARIGAPEIWLGPSSTQVRAAAAPPKLARTGPDRPRGCVIGCCLQCWPRPGCA